MMACQLRVLDEYGLFVVRIRKRMYSGILVYRKRTHVPPSKLGLSSIVPLSVYPVKWNFYSLKKSPSYSGNPCDRILCLLNNSPT